MSRLTKDVRHTILKRLMTRAFKDRIMAQYAKEEAFFDEVYADTFKLELPLLTQVPERWLTKQNQLRGTFGAETTTIYTYGLRWEMPDAFQICGTSRKTRSVIVPPGHTYVFGYDGRHRLSEKFHKIQAERDDLLAEVSLASKKTSALLEATSSFKKLIEAWPDLQDLITDLMESPVRASLPAITIQEMNTIFKLPPDSAAA